MRRILPNLVSALRLVLAGPLAYGLWQGQHDAAWRWAVAALFLLIAGSDWADGLLARRLNARTALGRALDPAADKLVALAAFVLLAVPGSDGAYVRVPMWLAAIVVGKDLWTVAGYAVIRMMGIQITVRPSRWGKASTFLQLCLVGVVLAGPLLSGTGLVRLAGPLVWATGVMTAIAWGHYTWVAVRRLASVRLAPVGARAGDY